MEFRDLGIRKLCDISGKHENHSYQDQSLNSENNIGHRLTQTNTDIGPSRLVEV